MLVVLRLTRLEAAGDPDQLADGLVVTMRLGVAGRDHADPEPEMTRTAAAGTQDSRLFRGLFNTRGRKNQASAGGVIGDNGLDDQRTGVCLERGET
jgi:hypothetical protein